MRKYLFCSGPWVVFNLLRGDKFPFHWRLSAFECLAINLRADFVEDLSESWPRIRAYIIPSLFVCVSFFSYFLPIPTPLMLKTKLPTGSRKTKRNETKTHQQAAKSADRQTVYMSNQADMPGISIYADINISVSGYVYNVHI